MAAMTTTDPGSVPTRAASGAGPLTTVFHTPEFCGPDRWTDIGTHPLSSSICMPPNFMNYYGNRGGMYSPGICPDGYTEGCDFPTALPAMENGTPLYGGPLLAGETARICCPTSYTCFTGPHTYPDTPYSKCISAGHSSRTYVESLTTHTDRNLVYAIQVRWQSSDLSNLETDPTVPGSTFSGPTATSTPPPDDDSRSHMPFQAILAITIAVILFAALMAIVGWLVWRRHFWKQQVIHREKAASTADLLAKSGEANNLHDSADRDPPLAQPAPAFSRPGTSLSGYVVSPMTPATGGAPSTIHEAPADTRQPMELEVLEEAQELPASMSFGPVELEGSLPADWAPSQSQAQQQPQPQTPTQQQHQEQEGAYTTSKSNGSDAAGGDEKSPGGSSVTRRRRSLGVNRLTTQSNPPPPYKDEP
ncbi:hypothetical protein PG985_007642 [Apiospora marii]|uniref:Uncharacterized protein n=1 Tax=Apiospora marii TaxID=335849 RepID=A0ABR1SN11_9PEZI